MLCLDMLCLGLQMSHWLTDIKKRMGMASFIYPDGLSWGSTLDDDDDDSDDDDIYFLALLT